MTGKQGPDTRKKSTQGKRRGRNQRDLKRQKSAQEPGRAEVFVILGGGLKINIRSDDVSFIICYV